MSLIGNLKHKIIHSLIFGIAIILILVIYADIGDLTSAFLHFKWKYIPLIIGCTVINIMIRFCKWEYYLSRLGIRVAKKDSAIVFVSGITMSITPAKLGEVLKSYLLKQMDDISISRTMPIVFAERLTDLFGLVILSSVGAITFHYGEIVLIVVLLVIFSIVVVIQSRYLSLRLLAFGERLPVLSNFVPHLHELYESAFVLLRLYPLLVTIAISAVSWFFECLAFWYVLKGLGVDMSIISSTFVFAFSSIAGAVSMLPGGLGVAEGSIVGLLYMMDVPKTVAVSAALIIRFCTLWFGVVIGLVSLFIFAKKYIPVTSNLDGN